MLPTCGGRCQRPGPAGRGPLVRPRPVPRPGGFARRLRRAAASRLHNRATVTSFAMAYVPAGRVRLVRVTAVLGGWPFTDGSRPRRPARGALRGASRLVIGPHRAGAAPVTPSRRAAAPPDRWHRGSGARDIGHCGAFGPGGSPEPARETGSQFSAPNMDFPPARPRAGCDAIRSNSSRLLWSGSDPPVRDEQQSLAVPSASAGSGSLFNGAGRRLAARVRCTSSSDNVWRQPSCAASNTTRQVFSVYLIQAAGSGSSARGGGNKPRRPGAAVRARRFCRQVRAPRHRWWRWGGAGTLTA
jgi:hypothetical protein